MSCEYQILKFDSVLGSRELAIENDFLCVELVEVRF